MEARAAALQLQLALSGRLVLPVAEQKDPLSISLPPPPPDEAAPSQHLHTDHSNDYKSKSVRYLLGRSKQQLEKIAVSSEQVSFNLFFSHFDHSNSYVTVRRKIQRSVMRMCFFILLLNLAFFCSSKCAYVCRNYEIDTSHAILVIGCKKVIAKVGVIQKLKVPSLYSFDPWMHMHLEISENRL